MELSGICLGVSTLPQQNGDTRPPLTVVDVEGLNVLTSHAEEVQHLEKGDNITLDVNFRTNNSGRTTVWLNSVVDTD